MERWWFRSIAAAFGITTICCFWIVGPLVSPFHDAIYHWNGPASTIFIPSFLDFICVWVIFGCLLLASQAIKKGSAKIWTGIMFWLPWAALKSLSLLMNWNVAPWISLGVLGICIIVYLLFTLLFKPMHQAGFERLQRLTTSFFCLVGVYGALIMVQLMWFGWEARGFNGPLPLHRAKTSHLEMKGDHPRLIWIVLDELSYQQVFGHRFQNLSLPAFDQLAKQSTVFTHVVPAGIATEIIMPSLMAGVPVDQIRPSSTGRTLLIHNMSTHRWQTFDPHDTVFSDALSATYTTAIAGWYNPYCRILPEVLDRCFWTVDMPSQNKMLPQSSFLENMFNPVLLSSSIINRIPSAIIHGNRPDNLISKLHIASYQKISDESDRLIRDSSVDFILIHMSIPHPGGIYNQATHSFASQHSSYIDNLALADLYLSHVRSLLDSMGQWDSSAVVVMGDHSWRTKLLWANSPDWTPDEQLASDGGQFDDRPAYIVKLPKQTKGNAIVLPFDAVHTRILLDYIMQKRILSPEDLSAWVSSLTDRKQ